MTIALHAIAFVHALVWVRDQRTLLPLLFAVSALAGAGFAVGEATFDQVLVLKIHPRPVVGTPSR